MKTILTFILLGLGLTCYAQKSDTTTMRSRTIRDGFTEKYTVLKSNKNIKKGFAEVLFNQQQIASGQYNNNRRFNQWKFYFLNGEVEQIYNYTTKKVEYEFENKSTTYFLENLKDGDESINPVKIGGSYATAIVMSKMPNFMIDLRNKKGTYTISYIYSLDEFGNLTKLERKVVGENFSKSENIDSTLLEPEELEFNPGYVNGKPIKSSITINNTFTIN
ncbi:hypothetical protein EZ449_09765 [Pedobacter frigidisoli]|uniref:Outer membrane lipoprotein-sorting protein n=1 Tax=Pedobacter frigidisoli TaxID=2530455 RepID=A0A4R0P5K4_9SPHI|nr:hypothetical protein [Pedobacter frigidisoli]TCD10619.1 hypothetical protein EZ449_09765 [Pedobacter frigidisoli]